MSMVTVKHPVIAGNTRGVPESAVEAWVAAGWVVAETPADEVVPVEPVTADTTTVPQPAEAPIESATVQVEPGPGEATRDGE